PNISITQNRAPINAKPFAESYRLNQISTSHPRNLNCSPSVFSQHASRMRVIHPQQTISSQNPTILPQRRNGPVMRKQSVSQNRHRPGLCPPNLSLQVLSIPMLKPLNLCPKKLQRVLQTA